MQQPASTPQNRQPRPALEPGDLLPRFALTSADGEKLCLEDDALSGRPTALVLVRDPANPQALALLKALQAAREEVEGLGGQVLAIARQAPQTMKETAKAEGLSLPLLSDPQGDSFARFGHWPAQGPVILLLAANRHLRAVVGPPATAAPPEATAAVLQDLRAQAAARKPVTMGMHPPVLILPEVLSRAECRHLIHLYDTENDNWQEPGHGGKNQTSNYKIKVPEYGRKDRIDHFLAERTIQELISFRLQNRLFPEIRRAFQYQVTRAETYRIGCYTGARGGIQHGHRDNSQDIVAHRRFACSINLNREEFEGGELRFPEFGDQRYQPETGAAICFSCSLLHEALEVTKGKRYVLMAFLFGES